MTGSTQGTQGTQRNQASENTVVKVPQYAENPIYNTIDSAVTSMMVSIYDAINPQGIQLTEEQIKQIMQKQQTGGVYKGFVQDFLDYFNNLLFEDYPMLGYGLMAMAAYVAYKMVSKCIVVYYS